MKFFNRTPQEIHSHNLPDAGLELAQVAIPVTEIVTDASMRQKEGRLIIGDSVGVELVPVHGSAHEVQADEPEQLTVGGTKYYGYETNAPEITDSLFTTEAKKLAVIPSRLDDMPAGKYVVTRQKRFYENGQDMGVQPIVEKHIVITDTPKGKVVNPEAFTIRYANKNVNANTGRLLTDLGYVIGDDGRIEGTPTPATLKECAAGVGVDIELLDAAKIDSKRFLEVYADGKYAVSATTEEWYLHDINDDHLTTMVLGGNVLKQLLKKAAARALETNDESIINSATSAIDLFTNSLGGSLYMRKGQFSTGFKGVLEKGKELGMTSEEINEVMDAARENAIAYGIDILPDPRLV